MLENGPTCFIVMLMRSMEHLEERFLPSMPSQVFYYAFELIKIILLQLFTDDVER